MGVCFILKKDGAVMLVDAVEFKCVYKKYMFMERVLSDFKFSVFVTNCSCCCKGFLVKMSKLCKHHADYAKNFRLDLQVRKIGSRGQKKKT